MVQSGVIFRKHNDPNCIKLMECWANELQFKSHRDQLSFNYAVGKLKLTLIMLINIFLIVIILDAIVSTIK